MLPSVIRVWRGTESAEITNTAEELALWAGEGFHPREEDKALVAGSAPAQPPVDAAGLRLDGPTLEEYVAAGYQASGYPPKGYAEKDSPALAQLKTERNTLSGTQTSGLAQEAPAGSPAPTDIQPASEASKPAAGAEKAPEKPSGKGGKGQQA